jgi:hypothetical protein
MAKKVDFHFFFHFHASIGRGAVLHPRRLSLIPVSSHSGKSTRPSVALKLAQIPLANKTTASSRKINPSRKGIFLPKKGGKNIINSTISSGTWEK